MGICRAQTSDMAEQSYFNANCQSDCDRKACPGVNLIWRFGGKTEVRETGD